MSSLPNLTPPAAPRWQLSSPAAFALLASVVVAFLAASSAPSPLYALYREAWGFSALTLTLVFAVYAFALLGGLLLFGGMSDYLGRRPLLLAALALELGAIALFRWADGVSWLLAARMLQGLATGIATATLSAAMLDLHRDRGTLVNSLAPMIGMGIGALGSSAVAQWLPRPADITFDLLLAVFAVQTLAATALPETVRRRPVAWQAMRPRLSAPAPARTALLSLLPMNSAQWALGGFYLSLGPTLARSITGHSSPMVGGALIATLVFSGAGGILWMRSRPALQALRAAAAILVLGLFMTLWGMQLHMAALLYAGSAVAGVGFGAGFNASVRTLVPLAPPDQRGALMSTFFVLSYLAFSIPALLAGLATGQFGLEPAALGYGLILLLLCVSAAWRLSRFARLQQAAAGS
jgi:MFS family permease